MDAPLPNALPAWDHLKIGAMYTLTFEGSGREARGRLEDARVLETRGGQAGPLLLAFTMDDRSGAATVPISALESLQPDA